jgi:hypothetical protein
MENQKDSYTFLLNNTIGNIMKHEEKIDWMIKWAHKNKCRLELEGECGFGRPCVGILSDEMYPSYHWYDSKTYEPLDNNGNVWCPENAYHKSDVVAVLGRGEYAETQLYVWLKWFDDNGFKLVVTPRDISKDEHPIQTMLYGMYDHRMVRSAE